MYDTPAHPDWLYVPRISYVKLFAAMARWRDYHFTYERIWLITDNGVVNTPTDTFDNSHTQANEAREAAGWERVAVRDGLMLWTPGGPEDAFPLLLAPPEPPPDDLLTRQYIAAARTFACVMTQQLVINQAVCLHSVATFGDRTPHHLHNQHK